MKVPLLDLRPQYAALREEIDAAIQSVLDSQHFVLGPEVEGLETEIAEYCGAAHGVGCGSGSDALLLPLMAMGIGPGDQIVMPTYTFFATAGSVARLGAEPVFADLEPGSYNATPETLAAAAAGCKRLKGLLPVDLFGRTGDIEGIKALAEDLGVPVLEDAAQAIGAVDDAGRRTGGAGIPACFSFFPTKNLGGFGEGGMVVTDDAELAHAMTMLRVHGMEPKYHHSRIGLNARLDALQAAVLRVKLRHLEGWHEGRQANARHYDGLFAAAGAASSATPLADGGFPIRIPEWPQEPARHIFNQYVIRVPAERRDPLRAFLQERGVGSEVYYPIPLHLQDCFTSLGGRPGDLPEAEAAARETLALPIFPDLEKPQLDHVATSVLEFLAV